MKTELYKMLDNLISDDGDKSANAEVNFHNYLQSKMQTQLGITNPSLADVKDDQAKADPDTTES